MVGQEFVSLLTDPMPESATESLPESVVSVLFPGFKSVFSVPPPTGQSILAVIWLVLVSLWADWSPFWVLPLDGGVTVMLGTELSPGPMLLVVNGLDLDFGDSRASTDLDFGTSPMPEEGLCVDPEEETRSVPENLLIRSLMLLARYRFELRDRPVDAFLWPALQGSASSTLVVLQKLSGDLEEVDSGECCKRWTQSHIAKTLLTRSLSADVSC